MEEIILYIGILLGTIALCGVAVLLLTYTQTKKLSVTKINASPYGSTAIPKRICLISDLHFPNCFVNIDNLIDRIVATETDAIMIAGDICTDHRKGEKMATDFLEKLSVKSSVNIFIVLGNHDYGESKRKYDAQEMNRYKNLLKGCGENIKLLDNEIYAQNIRGTDSRILIAGISDYRNTFELTSKSVYEEALLEANDKDTLVVLTHNPDTIMSIDENLKNSNRNNLILSGHTHGGQFWLPFNLEFLILRSDRLPKKGYKYGLYDWNENAKLFITCGLGESLLPIRFLTTPEIVFIDY